MLKKILLVLVVLVAGLFAFAATRPDTYEVSRNTLIKAPVSTVHGIVNDFHNFPSWSPWQKLDPAMRVTHAGPENGVGASYSWSGNDKAGEGSMKIIDSQPSKIDMQLDFLKPFPSNNTIDFGFVPEGDATRVTWTMHGRNTFMTKLMGIFYSMDKMVGPDFEEGLANLKRVAEAKH